MFKTALKILHIIILLASCWKTKIRALWPLCIPPSGGMNLFVYWNTFVFLQLKTKPKLPF